jgi:6-phosphogluconolactonase
MNRPAKSVNAFSATGLLAVLILGFAGQSFGDTKPKFVYVANSGQSTAGEVVQTFQVTATATCINHPCASTISISGSFTVDLTYGELSSGTLVLTDPNDLASSPLALSNGFLSDSGTGIGFGPPAPASSVMLFFPFGFTFPPAYSGGMLCTVAYTSGCSSTSSVVIAPAGQSPSLLATTGGTPVTLTISSASITLVPSTQGSNSISGYAVNSTTGALTLLPGSPFAAGSDPVSVAVDPSNKFVYVANHGSNNISAFAVNSATGALSQVAGSPFAAGTGPNTVAVDPVSNFVYVTNGTSNNVSAYSLDSETGAMTAVPGSPFAAGTGPVSLTVDPLGRFVYVMDNFYGATTDFGTLPYTINSATGALTPAPGSLSVPYGPLAAVVDPSGKFLFEINYFNPFWGVSADTINGSTGGLTSAPSGSGDVVPGSVAVYPSGKFLYVTDIGFNYVVAFTFDSVTGALALVPGSAEDNYGFWNVSAGPYATGRNPRSIVIDPSGKFAYVGNVYSNNISAFSIDVTSGALAPIPGTPFPAGVGPASVAIVSSSSVPFEAFKAQAEIDEDRETSFRVEGFFKLGQGSDGIYPLSETVALQVGSFSATIPAGSFKEEGEHTFKFEGKINDVDLKITIQRIDGKRNDGKHDDGKHVEGNDYLFTAEGKGNILSGIVNPVTVGLTIGDDEGSTMLKADIDK